MGSRESMLLGVSAGDHADLAREAGVPSLTYAQPPPFQIVHGTADEHIPIAQSQRRDSASAAATIDLVRRGANHFFASTRSGR
jgi:fermentation-respiration switch protein FrsA (DUF1100 family)